VVPKGIELHFNFDVDPASTTFANNWHAEMWDYLWSKKYGSDQFSVFQPGQKGRDIVSVADAFLKDSQTVHLTIPDIHPCDQLLLEIETRDRTGEPFLERAYLTIHAIPEASNTAN
jgi:hypothetical protein